MRPSIIPVIATIFFVTSFLPVPAAAATATEATATTKEERLFIKNFTLVEEIKESFTENTLYKIRRYHFNTENIAYTDEIFLPGETLDIFYRNEDAQITQIENYESGILPYAALYLHTGQDSLFVSPPAVYENDISSNSLRVVPEKETPVSITKTTDGFTVTATFLTAPDTFGEWYYLISDEPLVPVADAYRLSLLNHDFYLEQRWSMDGYYRITPDSYVPTGENIFYQNHAMFIGTALARYNHTPLCHQLGYVMMKTGVQNQTDKGYWKTASLALWLQKDYGIPENFYDTRFNTDFATGLIFAYRNYQDPVFLDSLEKYVAFFKDYAEKNHHSTGEGILVADYTHENPHKKTHASLNHHVAEMNFLYQYYLLSGDEECLQLADRMLLGIEETKDKWIMEDHNLYYALYTGQTPTIDYPYLTYNDLFELRVILEENFNRESQAVNELMAHKKIWMDANEITGYRRDL